MKWLGSIVSSRLASRLACTAALVCVALPVAEAQPRRTTDAPAAREARTTARATSPGGRPRARPARAPAAPPPIAVRVEPLPSSRYHLSVSIENTSGDALTEVVGDHRLVSLEVRPLTDGRRRARPLRCAHPTNQRRVDAARIVRAPFASSVVWSEPIDLRMYCTGRALAALDQGADVVVRYGFVRSGRGSFVAKAGSDAPTTVVETAPAALLPPLVPPATGEDAPVRVGMIPGDAPRGGTVVLRAHVSAGARPVRVYPRDDLWSFHVVGPTGQGACGLSREPVVPIVDFFQRLSGRRRVGSALEASRHCPGRFDRPGIYEVTPRIDLVYGGERFGIDAVTGTFTGPPSFVRIRPAPSTYVPLEIPSGTN